MGCQSNVCSMVGNTEAVAAPAGLVEAAETLACLLADTKELQNFVRQARSVRLDGEVNRFLSMINGYPEADVPQPAPAEMLEERLEGLPVVQEYRRAEIAAHELFTAVEEAISGAAGFAFAEHARPCAGT